MSSPMHSGPFRLRAVTGTLLLILLLSSNLAARETSPAGKKSAVSVKRAVLVEPPLDDSLVLNPPPDLELRPDNERKANALVRFVEGQRLEEAGEVEAALEAYQKVLNVDPGEIELALHVAALLVRLDDYPRAIDVLKDAIKDKPQVPLPYLQLALIYSKYLKKHEQALRYAKEGLARDPKNILAYQRLYEVEVAAGHPERALEALERAQQIKTKDAAFWLRLGKLFASVAFKIGEEPAPEMLGRVNSIFRRALETAENNPRILKEVGDYFAGSNQLTDAIPIYLRVLKLQPDDINAREKVATGFVLTNQRPQAIAMLEEVIKKEPENAYAYELLGSVFEDEGRALERENRTDEAKAAFRKAAQNYEQLLLLKKDRPAVHLRLAEILLGRLRDNERAIKLLTEARQRFAGAPEFSYYLAIALREAKRSREAVTLFEEALHESELLGASILTGRFYFDYGAAAEQAGLFDKAADLMRTAMAKDPTLAAEAYNYIGYMWADNNLHLDEAEELIRRALELDPNNGAYLDSLGWVKYRKGKYDEALDDLLRAAQHLTRPDATVFDHIGDVYAKLDNLPQALEYWQRAVALEPSNKAISGKIESTKTKVSQKSAGNPKS